MTSEQELRKFCSVRGNEADEFRKALVEGPAFAYRVPDEMSDSKRSEFFTCVPGSQSGDRAVAFVLPDTFADSIGLSAGNAGV